MLKVTDLHVSYGQSEALHGVSFTAQPNETIAIMGRNGMGKTTLFKALIGILPVKAGTITIDGQEISQEESYQRVARGVAYVPQGRMIFPNLTVLENIETGMEQSLLKAVPEEIYELFPVLQSMLKRRGGDLSGGQQQQLAIGRALTMRPKLLLLDEPTEGIQPSVIKDIGRAIIYLRQRGDMAIVLVEQYLDFAHELADDFAVMDRGEVVLSGTRETFDVEAVRKHMTV